MYSTNGVWLKYKISQPVNVQSTLSQIRYQGRKKENKKQPLPQTLLTILITSID